VSATTTMLIGCAEVLTQSAAGASAGFAAAGVVSPAFFSPASPAGGPLASGFSAASGLAGSGGFGGPGKGRVGHAGHVGGENVALVVRLKLTEEAGNIGQPDQFLGRDLGRIGRGCDQRLDPRLGALEGLDDAG